MPLRPKPWIAGASPTPHGGPQAAELTALGISPEQVIDFSVNINPFGPPPGVREAVARAAVERYPDPEATGLRRLLASRLGVGLHSILAGNGTTELIRLVALCYLGPGDTALIPQPAFGEYEAACRLAGAQVIKPWAREADGFVPDVAELVGLVKRHRPRVLFLGNPANPAGCYLSRQSVEALLEASPECLVALDEAFVSFIEGAWPATELLSYPNLVLLRSMTKDYALAGLRLGYAVAPEPVIAVLRRACPPWNVNAAALAAGEAALQDDRFLVESMRKIREVKETLAAELVRLGLAPVPSPAPFLLVKVGDATALHRSLLREGILVRDCASFGLPQYIRLGPRPEADCRRLLSALGGLGRTLKGNFFGQKSSPRKARRTYRHFTMASWRPAVPGAVVLAPGSCGELVQGTMDGIHFHISCPVDLFSRVTVSLAPEGPLSCPVDCPKAGAALRAVLARNGEGGWAGQLSVASPIPRGKGMASSTADILGAVAAAGLALGVTIGPEEIARIALSIEPTDGTIFPGVVLFDHRGGRLLRHLGTPPPLDIVVLDFGGEVDTIEFNRIDRSALLRSLEPQAAEAAALVEAGIRQGDTARIGEGATLSALAHQQVSYKPYLEKVLALGREAGAVGVCVGHSGTVVGALVDPRQRCREEVARFLKARLSAIQRVFLVSLIGGGYRPYSKEADVAAGAGDKAD